MFYFLLGIFFGLMIIEPLVINFIYFTNIDLFLDIILTKKNKLKLIRYFYNKSVGD